MLPVKFDWWTGRPGVDGVEYTLSAVVTQKPGHLPLQACPPRCPGSPRHQDGAVMVMC